MKKMTKITKKKKERIINEDSISEIDFECYGVEYEYSSGKGDHENCDGICRCRKITDVEIKKVDTISVSYAICSEFKIKDEITEYCIGRVVSRLHEDSFYVDVKKGYYGEEINGVFLEDRNVLRYLVKILNEKDSDDQVRIALEFEYGYLLDSLKTCNFLVREISLCAIKVGSEEHYKKLNKNAIENYESDLKKGSDGIYGICKSYLTAPLYSHKLIDGYHRFYALNKLKIKKAKFLVVL